MCYRRKGSPQACGWTGRRIAKASLRTGLAMTEWGRLREASGVFACCSNACFVIARSAATWQSVFPGLSPVSCLSSPVPRKPPPGNLKGAEPPWPSGKDSKGNRLGIGFLWRFLLPLSLAAKKEARRRHSPSPPRGQARRSGHCEAPAGPRQSVPPSNPPSPPGAVWPPPEGAVAEGDWGSRCEFASASGGVSFRLRLA